MSIEVKNLTYIYNAGSPFQRKALDDISLTIEDGDYFGIVGHTGSGKSTLVSHLNGLTKLTHGSIKIGDIDLGEKYDYKKLRAKVGMVFQYPEYQLFDETVERDVGFGCRNIGIGEEETATRVKRAIELVGLDYKSIKDRSPFELSGGQMRRAALAGVLVMNPEILVLDEPTAGLDPRGKKEILELIDRVRETCPTIIMISHNMDEIADCCNKIAVLDQGKLKGVFSPNELFVQKEMIEQMGLKLPSVAEIVSLLAEKGISLPVTCSENKLVDMLADYLERKDA